MAIEIQHTVENDPITGDLYDEWYQIDAFSKKVENDYYSAISKSIQVDRGYYYRVHASHIVCMAGSPDEETFSVTNGILVP